MLLFKPKGNSSPRLFYGYVIVAIAFLVLMLIMGIAYSFGVFFNPLLDEFGWSRTMISGAVSLSAMMVGVFAIVMGGLNDRFGPRRIMTVSGLFVGLSLILMSRVSEIWHVYLFYGIIFGISASAPYMTQAASVTHWFVKRRGTMIGIFVAGVGAGAVILPPIAGRMIEAFGWRTAYLILGGAVMVLLILAAQFMRRSPADMGQTAYGADEIRTTVDDHRPRPVSISMKQILS